MIDKNVNNETILYGQQADLQTEARIEGECAVLVADMNEALSVGSMRPTSSMVARTKTVINQMIVLLLKYRRNVKELDDLLESTEEERDDLESIQMILTKAQRIFADEAGYIGGFRMKTTKKPPWDDFLSKGSK